MTAKAATDPAVHGTRTVERALALLAEVAANDGLSLAEVARRVGLSPPTALRLLRTLESGEYVVRDGHGAYHGGSHLIQIAATYMGSIPLYRLADRHLTELRDQTGETSYLGVFGPGSTCLYARLAESDHAIRHVSWLGKTVPLGGTAIGAALLGHCNRRGYVSTRHTMEDNTTAIAAPVYWPVNTVTAALSVVGPTFRISEAKMRSIGQLVVAHADELANELGMPAQSAGVAGGRWGRKSLTSH